MQGWLAALHGIVRELHEDDLVTVEERDALLSGEAVLPANGEARRRLEFFAESLDDNFLKKAPCWWMEPVLLCALLSGACLACLFYLAWSGLSYRHARTTYVRMVSIST